MLRTLRLLMVLALASLAPAAAQAPTRVALVIANGAYQSVPALTNPARDAALVAGALSRAGFSVTPVARDVTRPAFEAALRDFKRRADVADIALVYYAGHGIELEEQNWLLPVDARIADPADAHTEGVSLSTVLRYVAGAKRARIVVLDACRDNPFALRLQSPTRSIARGLKPVEGLPPGTVVAYAASFGQVAAEGVGQQNSPFAASLARRLVEPGLEVRFLFASVRDDVIAANASSAIAAVRSQRPWIGAELPAEQIYFVPPRPVQNADNSAVLRQLEEARNRIAELEAAARGASQPQANTPTLARPSTTTTASTWTLERLQAERAQWNAGDLSRYNGGYFMVSKLEGVGQGPTSQSFAVGSILRLSRADPRSSTGDIVYAWSSQQFGQYVGWSIGSVYLTFLGREWRPEWVALADTAHATALESERSRFRYRCRLNGASCS